MKRENFTMEDGAVIVEYYGDGHAAHYILTGERFQHSNELLKLMLQYGGACTDNPKRYATAYACNYNCSECERSIYNIIRVKEKFFTKKCMELIQRVPRKNDEWEISLVNYDNTSSHPKYENYFFRTESAVFRRTIIELISDLLTERYPEFKEGAKYCYIKVRRFDMDKAIDVSVVGNAELNLSNKADLIG